MKTPRGKLFRRVASVIAASLVLAVGNVSSDERPSLEAMISSAKTAADHDAIAARYDQEAAAAKVKADEHRAMLERYLELGGPYVTKWHLDSHCRGLVKVYGKVAEDNAKMAEAHRAMAK